MNKLSATWTLLVTKRVAQKEKPVSFWFDLTFSFSFNKETTSRRRETAVFSTATVRVLFWYSFMSTESELIQSSSDAVGGSNASRIEVGNDQMSETLADPLSLGSQAEKIEAKHDRDEQEGCGSLASAGDHGMEKVNGFTDLEKQTESVNGELDLGIRTQTVDAETNESEKKVPVDSEDVLMIEDETKLCEKDSDGIQTDLLVEKEADDANLSDSKGSGVKLDSEDLGEDRKSDGSGTRGRKVENFDVDESSDESVSDDDLAPVTTKVKFSHSDLVWAKVRSHPWWPGQVFDASAATDKAKKYSKKGSFLITYFGDCSFAWNDASRIKPFRQHFSQLAKQSSLPDFVDAIDFALEEVSRRIEFGLACPCISEDVYQKIKTQTVINPGILEDSSRLHGGDEVSSAVSFEPVNLVQYVKGLASHPNNGATDELQFVSHRAQLLAFNRWKGFSELPEFETLQGSVESAPKIAPAEEKESLVEVKVSVPKPKKPDQVYTKRRKTENQDDCKHEAVFEYEDATVLKRKEKTLAEFIAEKRLSKRNGKRSRESSSIKPESEKKRKVVSPKLPKSTKKIKPNLQTKDPGSPKSLKNDRKHSLSAGDKITPKKARESFGIGASILKAANQMHCSTPTGLIPCGNSTSKKAAKNNGSGNSLQKKSKAKALSEREISPSPSETHSSPHSTSAAKTSNGKPSPISVDHQQSGAHEEVVKETPNTGLVEDSMLKNVDLKDSCEEQMVNEDRNEDGSKITIEDSNLTEEKVA
ncbi:unnamed protein product [Microthlaspi erraticum]|uniref:PWWP domain-containing protein n=1 Tax=Microthlaspi erraticum TaxID=1685480 RepID=A0A6D2JXA0_9BRAS|nr:unnamed protein product [Microthlaspi erraticum]